MTNSLENAARRIVAKMDEQHTGQEQELPGTTEQETHPEETIHIHYFPDAIVILKEEDQAQVVESTPVMPQKTSCLPAYAICCFYLLLIVSTLAFQLSCIFNPPIATGTIVPTSQRVTLSGILQIGRLLIPITISQSQTIPTTGKGHQDAKAATGTVTFYNGLFTSQTIAAGTILTGTDGVQVATDETVTLPPNNPPVDGQATVSAHALNKGAQGNIQAGDIDVTISNSVLVRNSAFQGGADERDYQTVAKRDIDQTAAPLKATLTQSLNGALQGQHKPDEQVFLLPCRPTVTSDHRIGQEATQVNVTVSQTCSAVAYSSQELETKATVFLIHQSAPKPGAGYSLFGTVHVSVKQASVSHTTTLLVFLSFSASGTWVYGLSQQAQEQIKHLIAGKTTQEAVQLLTSLPGVERAAIRFAGFGEETKLPKQSSSIHIALLVV